MRIKAAEHTDKMTRPCRSGQLSKAMRVPKKTAAAAAEIRALHADLLMMFEEGKRAGDIVEAEGPTKESRPRAKSLYGMHRNNKDGWLSPHSASFVELFRSKGKRGACEAPTLRSNQGFMLDSLCEPSTNKRVIKVAVLHGDSPREEGAMPLPRANDDASCASTPLGTPSRDSSRKTATSDTHSPEGIKGSISGWLKTSCLKIFMPTNAKEKNTNLNSAPVDIHMPG